MPVADAQSLRPWLAQLAATAAWSRSPRTLDPAAGLAARLVAHDREPVRIARVRGSELPLVANLLAEPRADRRGARRREDGLGAHLARRSRRRSTPVARRGRPCQELIEHDPDLARLPIPHFFEHEGGPYITAGCIVTRDPETGERNWSIARVRPLGGRARSSASRPTTTSRSRRAPRASAAGGCRSPSRSATTRR